MPPLKKQVRRVAAWIYVVINPIINSLGRELSLLESGNLTWRTTTHRCEMIRTIQEYVDSAQWPNYQDFVAEYPRSAFVAGFKHHDRGVEGLNNVAQILFDRMLSLPDFVHSVDQALTFYEKEIVSPNRPDAGSFATIRDDIPKIVAESLINNAPELPPHYLISPFWNSVARTRMVPFKDRPEFQPLYQATHTLAGHSGKLKQVLEQERLSLSRRYDVPAAPVPGLSFEN